MKILLLLLLALPVAAQEKDLAVGGVYDLIVEKAKEAKVAALVDLKATIGGAAFLPVWTFHAADNSRDYVECGIGASLKEGGKGDPFLSVALNLPALSAKIWSGQWASAHLRRAKFPPVWVGPYIAVPTPGRTWTWTTSVGGMISVRLGNP